MSDIQQLIDNLPELYQPIFERPQLSQNCSRESADRLREITAIYKALESKLGRPLRVLDLGCAQGFFSLSLGALGATVHGIDYSERNIELCNFLAAENPNIKASFWFGKIEDFLKTLEQDQFDLVLGLSVFHHLIYEHGIEHVQSLLNSILQRCQIFIAEFALKEEPLYWGDAQPEAPRELLEDVAFVHEIARYSTHLADIKRPLFVASNVFWCLDGQIEEIEDYTKNSHAFARGAHEGARKYIFSDRHVVKIFTTYGSHGQRNREEHRREVGFLSNPPDGFQTPKLYSHGEKEFESWIVTERLKGQLLLDVITREESYDGKQIVHEILDQLVQLEQHGLYHDDVRVWNVWLKDDGHAQILDFGSISSESDDCVWPHNIFMSFLVFIKEVMSGKVDLPEIRQKSISPAGMPSDFKEATYKLWKTPTNSWSFKLFSECIQSSINGISQSQDPNTLWMGIMDGSNHALHQHLNHVEHMVNTTKKALDDRLHEELLKVYAKVTSDVASVRTEAAQTAEENSAHAISELGQTSKLIAINTRLTEENSALVLQRVKLSERLARITEQKTKLVEDNMRMRHELELTRVELMGSQARTAEAQAVANEAQAVANEARALVNALKTSTSWRVTAPLRGVVSSGRSGPGKVAAKTIESLKPSVASAIGQVLKNQKLKSGLLVLIRKFPATHHRLRLFAERRGVLPQPPSAIDLFGTPPDVQDKAMNFELGQSPLSPRGQAIYQAIQDASDNRNNQ